MISLRRQAGSIIMMMVIVLVLASTSLLLANLNRLGSSQTRDTGRVASLAAAKQALIGYAANHPTRPGQMPCPDADGDGIAETTCTASAGNSMVGRLPWRSLGLKGRAGGTGETLWYVLSAGFAPAAAVINSETRGELTADGRPDAVAVLLAPGVAVAGQNGRPSNAAADYLEGENRNATGNDNYVGAPESDSFNDRLIAVYAEELFAVVERRVAREMRRLLNDYFTSNDYYPFAAAFDDGAGYFCDQDVTEGLLPLAIGDTFVPASGRACAGAAGWPTGPPAWFTGNGWHGMVVYVVSPDCVPGTIACGGSGGLITITGMASSNVARAVLFAAGRGLSGQSRPCTQVVDCLEGAENRDSDLAFQVPANTAGENDQLFVVAP